MSEDWRIQVSPKLADGTLINLRAQTPDEAERILNWAIENAPLIQKTTGAFGATATVAAAFPGSQVAGQEGPAWSQPNPTDPPPARPQGKMCSHGAMVYREAKPGSGKDWKAWFCPTPQNTPGQCKPEFVR